jgi:RNA polymerase sigma factor (sigma-70 family)
MCSTQRSNNLLHLFHATLLTSSVTYVYNLNGSMNQPPNNTALLERCRKKESAACRELYEQYARAMFNISMRIVNNKDEAEDILQESFIKAFSDMTRFNSIPEFGAWLKRVVVNHSLDVIRKQKLSFVPLEHIEDSETDTTEEKAQYDIKEVMEGVRMLPHGYRVILTLFLFEDYSHKEIAAMLNISEGTSKSQYNRAKKKLVELVQQKTLAI